MLTTIRRLGCLGVSLLATLAAPPGAGAAEARFQIDPSQDLAELARTGRVAIAVDRTNGVYVLDASAVLPVDPGALLAASLDYDHYVQMGVPNVRVSRVVRTEPGESLIYTWNWVSGLGQSSKHYLAIHVVGPSDPAGAAGIRWELARPLPDWPYAEASAFTRLDGSWYVEPLREGGVYVRYFVVAALDPTAPDRLVSWLVKQQFRDGTRRLVEVLAHEAWNRR